MLKKTSLIAIIILFAFATLNAANTILKVIGNGTEKTVTETAFVKMSKETFKAKKTADPFISFKQLLEITKADKAKTVTIKSLEGMSLVLKAKEFEKAGLIIVSDKKKPYFRVVVKDSAFRNRWIKNVVSIEFK
ncbi:MAG TPA: hypothetical protein PL063_07840 [Candidatus Cloacimonadota bacterium]|jgi:hypothetical protein|nr:hypothetical protein [Candidatus Cloacimonadales bacterium]HPY97109.1 hypothetical protein [Candidatus Cloacimonadota bacterium]HQB41136.1 hypothetical protein [Candidatus Cloacimonadota bacterium]